MSSQIDVVLDSAPATQQGNKSWWTNNPMSYEAWGKNRVQYPQYSREWFDAIDHRFIQAARHFAHTDVPFGKVIPFAELKGKRVLEVGCGMGLHSELIARADAQLTSIDLTPTSIEATRRRLALKNLTAEVKEFDAEKLQYENEFDFIWSWGVIHHSSRTGRVLRNLHTALKPGGELRFMVYNLEGMMAYSVMVRRYLLGFWTGRSLDELLWDKSDGYIARYFTRDSLTNLCRTFFEEVDLAVYGEEGDAIPLPSRLRRMVRPFVRDSYIARTVHKRGDFLFVTTKK
jgi:2-polyprenyl-3-methyl-5-hydroxy-6-metoxy-1,4-benzoquinol methylase